LNNYNDKSIEKKLENSQLTHVIVNPFLLRYNRLCYSHFNYNTMLQHSFCMNYYNIYNSKIESDAKLVKRIQNQKKIKREKKGQDVLKMCFA